MSVNNLGFCQEEYVSEIVINLDWCNFVSGETFETPSVKIPELQFFHWGIRVYSVVKYRCGNDITLLQIIQSRKEVPFEAHITIQSMRNEIQELKSFKMTEKLFVDNTEICSEIPSYFIPYYRLFDGPKLHRYTKIKCRLTFKKPNDINLQIDALFPRCDITGPTFSELTDRHGMPEADLSLRHNDEYIQVHKDFICLISKKLATTVNNLAENEDLIINKCWNKTVFKNVFDFILHGKSLKEMKLLDIIEMISFCRSYEINGAVETMENWLIVNMNITTFFQIISAKKFASDDDHVKDACLLFYAKNETNVRKHEDYRTLPDDLKWEFHRFVFLYSFIKF